jgi:vancomycin resistance protein YoaR
MAKAQSLVGKPITLTWTGGSATLTSAQLLAAITIDTNPKSSSPFTIGLSPEVLTTFVEPLTAKINVEMKNASARLINGKIKVLSDSTNGRALDVAKSVSAVIAAATSGKQNAPLIVDEVKAKYSAADLKKVKLSDLLGDSSTDYSAATDAKRTNIDVAAGLEDGWLVAPGDIFSYDQYIGPVDTSQGFVTGLGILADPSTGGITTGPVVGGGICQLSTTIFQAAFWAGMEVVERSTHPYWIATYGQPPHGMLGLDAMVNIDPAGSLDMQFRNTTGHWIAVVVTADGSTLTAKIMGTATGWNVDVQQPVISNYVDPESGTVYTDSPEVPTGETRQVESASRGFDASIRRIITDKSGNIIDDYTLTGTYVPSRDRVLVGTGPAN